MFERIVRSASAIILLCSFSAAFAVPPNEASVSGVKNVGWEPGNCEVASFGQLIMQRDPNITPAEVVVRAGVCTQAAWVGSGKSKVLVDHPRFIDMGKRVDAAHLFGVGYAVAWKPIGGRPYGIAKQADSMTTFKTTDEAVNQFKELIAAGTPVQVQVDTAWLAGYGGTHGSHFVAVHGYDLSNVYYCENGGADGTNENVVISWDDFISAWTQIAHIDPKHPGNECFMLWLTTDPVRLDSDWILAWLARDIDVTNKAKSPTGPDAIRAAAAAIRGGADGETAFGTWLRSIYGNWKPYMVEFLDDAGHSDLADQFEQACVIWANINSTLNPDWNNVCNLMEQAADIEEQVETEMLALGEGLDAVSIVAPAEDTNLSTLEDCTFRWAQMPDVSSVVLQLSMTGDFDDTSNVVVLKPNKYKKFVVTIQKDWLKMLARDGGDRRLLWRVGGLGKEAGKVSAEWSLSWAVQQMSSIAPDDGYSMAADELVTFTFESPWIAMNPCVVISTTDDFNDKSSQVVLKPKKEQTSVSFKTSTLSTLRKKDDGDKIVYWRVEDASTKKTKVVPSDVRSLNLP